MSCKVANCRFPLTHTTRGHICGNCNKPGHVRMECGNQEKIDELKHKYFHEIMPEDLKCVHVDCRDQYSHQSGAHHCIRCNGRNHSLGACIIQPLSKYRNLEYTRDFIINHTNSYIMTNMDMGCVLYIRNKNGIIMTLFMHSDSWGQYGENTSDVPKLNKFIENLTDKTNLFSTTFERANYSDYDGDSDDADIDIVKCPICRTEHTNNNTNIINIKGSSEQCNICYDNNVEKCFVKCGHACICATCFTKI